MRLDPLIPLTFGTALTGLFVGALYHKARDLRRFREALAGYGLVSAPLVKAAAILIVVLEMGVVVGYVSPVTRSAAVLLAATLLATYAMAMGVNLARGRKVADCGCTTSASAQPLSWWMVGRNVALIILALVALAPEGQRALSTADLVVAIMTVTMCALLYQLHAIIVTLNTRIRLGGRA